MSQAIHSYSNYLPSNLVKKIYDIACLGFNSKKRYHILNQLVKLNTTNLNIKNIKGFGQIRDDILFKCKILVNVHYADNYKIFEEIRCNRCTFNKMIVISEDSLYTDDYILKDHVIFVPYDKIAETVIDVANNYEKYYEKLFKNFDITKYEKIYKNKIDIFNKSIN